MKTIKQMLHILSKKEKVGFLLLFLGMFLNSFLEIFGLAILVPVVNIVAYPETAFDNQWYLRLFASIFRIDRSDTKTLLIVLVIFIAVLYLLKAAYYFLYQYWQRKFIAKFSRRLSIGLFENYLYQPYEFHVYHNSSELISRATYDVGGFVGGVNLIMSTLADIVFAASVFIYLLIAEWAITLIVFSVLGAATLFLNTAFKKRARAYGREAAIINAQQLKAIREGLAGIKEVKIANREEYFIDRYQSTMEQAQNLSIKRSVIEIIPRTLVEALGMIGMLVALMVYYLIGTPSEKILSTFTLLALSTVKLLPYVTRIAAGVNAFRGATYSIHRVYEDLQLMRETPVQVIKSESIEPLPFTDRVLLRNITFKYKSGTDPVLLNTEAVIQKGSSVAFCGRSGAGKTTTIDILLGLLKPQEGEVLCDGVNVTDKLEEWHANLAYVPQDIYLIDSSIKANVAFGYNLSEVADDQVWRALEKAQLAEFVRSLPDQLNTMIGEKGVRLSGGQRQRIGIARALFRDTPILILDEATSALDYETESDILNSVEGLKGEKTLVIITHRLNTIQNCDHIYRVEDGAITLEK